VSQVDYSVLRQGCSRQLLYKLLDEVVDNFLPITKAYRTRVRMLHDQLHRDDTKWDNQVRALRWRPDVRVRV
jgi:Mg2+ and Co2+ transporter CorA